MSDWTARTLHQQVFRAATVRMPLATEDGRSLTLTLAGHPQRAADTAQSVTTGGEANPRPWHAIVTPPRAPVTSTYNKHQ